ncbi:hypothetical protein FNAPI_10791 [Fusarium napiforme]|uniref:F-box domain-containing protein n=1 Tax=Fusarium napiforme TaxID=42672 RepID=A0A8H5IMJ2_9HYPO|nr:hypothetical protein FNAPI_10791 [Fusarium napiforme]
MTGIYAAMSTAWVHSSEVNDPYQGEAEARCMICDVSFHIGRHRTNGEHPSAAWNSHTDDDIEEAYPRRQYCEQPDCTSIPRAGSEHRTCLLAPRNLDYIRFEHVSGPNCRSTGAYHGSRISAEAMRECNTYQNLVAAEMCDGEPRQYEREDFENLGCYALNGLGDPAKDSQRGRNKAHAFPNRCNSPSRDDVKAGYTSFHPTCFEIFKRASIYRYGFVHINALTSWGDERGEPKFQLPEHVAVKRARQRLWLHHAGDEFLAANPCFVPGLQGIFDSVQNTCSSDDISSDVTSPNSTDIFSKLPQEIKLEILLQLDSWDIANLRLSSRTFRHLPQSLFYHLTLRELPWLYEAWTSAPLSFFVTTTAAEQRRLGKPLDKVRFQLAGRRKWGGGSEEEAADIARLAALEVELAEKQRQSYRITPVKMLDRGRTNWTRLRGELSRRWGELPGLRNRRRIWNNCQEIMEIADKYRLTY